MRKYSEIIEAAKKHLKTDEYVCIAVQEECKVFKHKLLQDEYELKAAKAICKLIEQVLGRDADGKLHTFDSRLKADNYALWEAESYKDDTLYELRLKFMDEQIEYWKSQGN